MDNTGLLAGKIAIVTGAASGMGLAEARLFAAEGATVIAADLAHSAGISPDGAILRCRLDVAEPQSWAELTDWIGQRFGKLDILVNNAGIHRLASLLDTTPELFDEVYRINQRGPFLGMRAVAPLMRQAGGGSIVNISSTAGLVGMPDRVAYVGTKWAVRGMTKTVALELARDNIRVNSVHPGLVDTPMTQRGTRDEQLERARATAFGRAADPGELAQLVLFLASDRASFCSGGEYTCDGAASAGPRANF
jgi:3alpha(or 20beta)-hydroxysteroid dehydrogenase